MILILASCHNDTAAGLAKRLPAAAVVTCADIATAASRFAHPDFENSYLTVGGRRIHPGEIDGVVNLLPAVAPSEMVFYAPEDAEYQAAEFQSLLQFWLSGLRCPVLNRPSPLSLNGPVANPLGWLYLARQAGVPVAPVTIDSNDFVNPFVRAEGQLEAIWLRGEIVQPSHSDADDHTAKLARHAGVEYLKARYSPDAALACASAVPDLAFLADRGFL